jgi:hypothetical protein
MEKGGGDYCSTDLHHLLKQMKLIFVDVGGGSTVFFLK